MPRGKRKTKTSTGDSTETAPSPAPSSTATEMSDDGSTNRWECFDLMIRKIEPFLKEAVFDQHNSLVNPNNGKRYFLLPWVYQEAKVEPPLLYKNKGFFKEQLHKHLKFDTFYQIANGQVEFGVLLNEHLAKMTSEKITINEVHAVLQNLPGQSMKITDLFLCLSRSVRLCRLRREVDILGLAKCYPEDFQLDGDILKRLSSPSLGAPSKETLSKGQSVIKKEQVSFEKLIKLIDPVLREGVFDMHNSVVNAMNDKRYFLFSWVLKEAKVESSLLHNEALKKKIRAHGKFVTFYQQTEGNDFALLLNEYYPKMSTESKTKAAVHSVLNSAPGQFVRVSDLFNDLPLRVKSCRLRREIDIQGLIKCYPNEFQCVNNGKFLLSNARPSWLSHQMDQRPLPLANVTVPSLTETPGATMTKRLDTEMPITNETVNELQSREEKFKNIIELIEPVLKESVFNQHNSIVNPDNDKRYFILPWIYSKAKIPASLLNSNKSYFRGKLMNHGKFVTFQQISGGTLQFGILLNDIYAKMTTETLVKQEAHRVLHATPGNSLKACELFHSLSEKSRLARMKKEDDVFNLIQLYPTEFAFNDIEITSLLYPTSINTKTVNCTKSLDNAVKNLLNHLNPTPENSLIEKWNKTEEKLFFNSNWILQKLPRQLRKQFPLQTISTGAFKEYLQNNSLFEVSGQGVHLKSIIKKMPTEDALLKDVFKILNKHNKAISLHQLHKELPSYACFRVRQEKVLKSFLTTPKCLKEVNVSDGNMVELVQKESGGHEENVFDLEAIPNLMLYVLQLASEVKKVRDGLLPVDIWNEMSEDFRKQIMKPKNIKKIVARFPEILEMRDNRVSIVLSSQYTNEMIKNRIVTSILSQHEPLQNLMEYQPQMYEFSKILTNLCLPFVNKKRLRNIILLFPHVFKINEEKTGILLPFIYDTIEAIKNVLLTTSSGNSVEDKLNQNYDNDDPFDTKVSMYREFLRVFKEDIIAKSLFSSESKASLNETSTLNSQEDPSLMSTKKMSFVCTFLQLMNPNLALLYAKKKGKILLHRHFLTEGLKVNPSEESFVSILSKPNMKIHCYIIDLDASVHEIYAVVQHAFIGPKKTEPIHSDALTVTLDEWEKFCDSQNCQQTKLASLQSELRLFRAGITPHFALGSKLRELVSRVQKEKRFQRKHLDQIEQKVVEAFPELFRIDKDFIILNEIDQARFLQFLMKFILPPSQDNPSDDIRLTPVSSYSALYSSPNGFILLDVKGLVRKENADFLIWINAGDKSYRLKAPSDMNDSLISILTDSHNQSVTFDFHCSTLTHNVCWSEIKDLKIYTSDDEQEKMVSKASIYNEVILSSSSSSDEEIDLTPIHQESQQYGNEIHVQVLDLSSHDEEELDEAQGVTSEESTILVGDKHDLSPQTEHKEDDSIAGLDLPSTGQYALEENHNSKIDAENKKKKKKDECVMS